VTTPVVRCAKEFKNFYFVYRSFETRSSQTSTCGGSKQGVRKLLLVEQVKKIIVVSALVLSLLLSIYISIYLGYINWFHSTEDYLSFLINSCGIGIVPFEYFGSKENKGWFRISIGNIDMDQIDELNETLYKAILKSHEISNSFY
jgi:hypothetical protein